MKIKEPLLEKLKKELAILCAMATISALLIIYHSIKNFDDIAVWTTFAIIAFFSAWSALRYVKAIKYRKKLLEQSNNNCK